MIEGVFVRVDFVQNINKLFSLKLFSFRFLISVYLQQCRYTTVKPGPVDMVLGKNENLFENLYIFLI